MKKALSTFAAFLLIGGMAKAQNTFPATGPAGIGTTTPVGMFQIKGPSTFDASTFLHITNNASDHGRTGLILTGRIQDGNDRWLFGTGARNAFVFAQNASPSQQGIGDIGLEKYSIQLEGNSASLGFLSASNGNNPNMVLAQNGNIGIGTSDPQYKIHVNGNHSNSRMLIHFEHNDQDPAKQADLSLWASEPGNTYTGVGVGNNIINSPGFPRINATRGGSYMRLLDQGVTLNVVKLDGTDISALSVDGNGNIGMGTVGPYNYKLSVNGNIRAKEIKVESGWADYVFEDDYKLQSLVEVEKFIKANKHLPEIPTAADVKENGVDLGAMNTQLLKKVEELTLHLIAQEKRINVLENQIKGQQKVKRGK